MIDLIVFEAASDRIAEGSRLNVTAKFRDQVARTDQTPTTVEWCLRDPDTCREFQAFDPLTPGTSVTIVTTATMNLACHRDERREITVLVDRGLVSQFTATYVYSIRNIGAIGK